MKNSRLSERKMEDRLSPKFWELAHALAGGWDMMNQILDKEWQVLRDRKFASIWNIGRHKEKLAAQLKAIEERIDAEIPGFDPDSHDAETRWTALLDAASPSEVSRLIQWKTRLAAGKKRAFMTNRRLWIWISEQQELSRELAAILSGRRRRKEEITYGANAVLATPPSRRANMVSERVVAESQEEGSFFKAFSPEKTSRALNAYRKTNSIEGMLE